MKQKDKKYFRKIGRNANKNSKGRHKPAGTKLARRFSKSENAIKRSLIAGFFYSRLCDYNLTRKSVGECMVHFVPAVA